ncbi:FHA domain-containing protein [Nocardia mangyaensis]|uniref:FHA domain-containing protein n=1 Tax=Nocardia mangyaensis TaxID=2213200 RepID=UPI0026767DAC|nr:FHA domain-containing protein [Nocardia mangyaensis]MDO3650618.1 FHA domain-containing protein [Nocardia mangyaensis]
MPVCADGHSSQSTDYCEVCGSTLDDVPAPDPTALRLCPSCATPTSGRFCEVCGYDSALPAPGGGDGQPPPRQVGTTRTDPPVSGTVWVARVFADREFYGRVQARKGPDAERVAFPDFCPERRIILRGSQFLIGKRSASQGIVPEIDLGIAPVDIGVSRAHAMIQVDPGGGLSITDLGSTNGTSVDGAEIPIPPQVAVPVGEGSRIHVGGWTTIAISATSIATES